MTQWYEENTGDTLRQLETSAESGLAAQAAEERRLQHGENRYEAQKKESILSKIGKQLKDVSNIVLILAALLSFLLAVREGGSFVEPIVITAIIIMNMALSISQEKSAEKALDALSELDSPTCLVLREGAQKEIDTAEVVPGDILILKTGDMIAADARLLEGNNLCADESSLTGESEAAEKDAAAVLAGRVDLGDQANMVFSGCMVTAGQGVAVVVETGMQTQMGKIAGHLNNSRQPSTPLQNRLGRVSKLITFIAIISAIVLFAVGTMQGEEFWSMILMAVSLAVAAVPETLNLIVTLTLTEGVKKMAAKNALIRNLPAVETLGSVSVICSDKTGTLTQNQMAVQRLWQTGNEPVAVQEEFTGEQLWLLKKLALASTATVEAQEDGSRRIFGDATETAIVRLLADKGVDIDELRTQYPKVAEIPFSSSRKMLTSVVQKPQGGYLVLTKGAIDRIPFLEGDLAAQKERKDTHDGFAADALRVIALGSREVDALPEDGRLEELEAGLAFEGFIGLMDPPRPEAAAAIREAKKAGIRTVMITGDHAATAAAIARELDIITANEGVITGAQLEKLTDEELFESVEFYSVYARVTPEDKIRIVQAWQRRGEVVAMTGDGVNDAPALKAADVGIAMGQKGTDVAKSAADMVLTDDRFSTIMDAVAEGRNVFSNIRKTIYFLLTCNISEIIIMLVARLLGWGSPVTAIMLLLINVLGDGIPGLALAKERSDARIMRRKPIGRNESFFGGGLMENIIRQTTVFSLVTLVAYYLGAFVNLSATVTPSHGVGQTLAFLVIAWTSILHIFTVRSRKSAFSTPLTENPQLATSAFALLLVFAAFVVVPPLASLFGLSAISGWHWLVAIGLSLIPTFAAEYNKMWDRRKQKSAESTMVVPIWDEQVD